MRNLYTYSLSLAIVVSIFLSCTGVQQKPAEEVRCDSDSIIAVQKAYEESKRHLPGNPLASVDDIIYSVTIFDTLTDGTVRYEDQVMWDSTVNDSPSLYDASCGSYTFRGGLRRDAAYGGTVKGVPSRIEKVWTFQTGYDGNPTPMGTWGGGSGWTGQPVYVHWTPERMEAFRRTSPALTDDFGPEEIIVGSLCEEVYFINFQSGKASRKPLDVTNPIKGSVSLDPTLNGNLYVGQGIPKVAPMGQMAWNLNTHTKTFFSGRDANSWVKWGAFDSSPVRLGRFLFWPGENGTFYKYLILPDCGGLKLHSTLRFKPKQRIAAGVENSLCVYRNYGYFGTNNGSVVCVDLNTLNPVWYYDNHDDIDASIVCAEEDGVPYLYCGSEVDHQGGTGYCYMVKLNGLTGEAVWQQNIKCNKLNIGEKHFDGGLYSTPLLGSGDCDSLLFANICQPGTTTSAEFTAFSRRTGDIIYKVPLHRFAWSSPVGFLNESGRLFIFAGDSYGNAYLIEGSTGKILYEEKMCNNFESSPVVVGNQLVVGSRGKEIIKYEIK